MAIYYANLRSVVFDPVRLRHTSESRGCLSLTEKRGTPFFCGRNVSRRRASILRTSFTSVPVDAVLTTPNYF